MTKSSLHFISDEEAILVIGTRNNPRSTVIKIGASLDAPIQFPLTTGEYLENIEQKHITLNSSKLSHPIKFCLSLILRKSITAKTTDIYLNEALKNWIERSLLFDEFYYFLQILISRFPKRRQNMLTRLVRMQSESGRILILILYHLRPEFSSSILREFGRRGIENKNLLNLSKKALLDKNHVSWFADLYLFQFDKNHELNSMESLRSSSIQLVRHSGHKSFRALNYIAKQSPHDLYKGLIYFSINNLVPNSILNKLLFQYVTPLTLRKALILPLKYAEMTRNPTLLASIMVLLSKDRTVHFNRYEQIITIPSQHRHLKYITRRANSLLNIWNQQNKTDLIQSFLIAYLMNLPSEIAIYRRGRYRYLDTKEWISSHEILSNYHMQVLLLLHNDEDLLESVILRLVRIENLMFFTWLLDYIDPNLFRSKISNLSFQNKLLLYTSNYYYPTEYNLFYLIKKGRKEINSIVTDYTPDRFSIKRALNFFYRLRFPLTSEIRLVLTNTLHEDQYELEKIDNLFQKYLMRAVPRFDISFSNLLAKDILNAIVNFGHENCPVCVRRLNVVIEWKETTGFELEENLQHMVLGIKLANSEIISKLEIDAITPIPLDSLSTAYKILNGEIHKIIEDNAAFAINKYNWDQLARHYLAMGISKPNREKLRKSQLRKIPSMLLKDQLGRIALVTEIFQYCITHGFTPGFEKVLRDNLYLRGWNVDAKLQNKIIQILGSVGHRLRSYLAAYLVIERNEISDEIILIARDVEKKMIRDRLMRSLERFGSANMWLLLAGSTYFDLSETAVNQIRRLRMAKDERVQLIQQLLNAEKSSLRKLGIEWMMNVDYIDDEPLHLFTSVYKDTWENIIKYYLKFKRRMLEFNPQSFLIFESMYWDPELSKSLYNSLIQLAKEVPQLLPHIAPLHNSVTKSRAEMIILSHEESDE